MLQRDITRAGFFRRAGAVAIDLVAVVVILAIIFIALSASGHLLAGPESDRQVYAIETVVVLLYSSAEILFAATPGKLLLGMRIGSIFGLPASGWVRFLRWSTKQGPWILAGVYVLLPHPLFKILAGFMSLIIFCGVFAATNDDHLAWHDQWSGSA